MTSTWSNCKQPIKGFHFLGISDIHLMHPRTPTEHILNNFKKQFYSDETNKLLDAIFISGDVFEAQRTLSDSRISAVEAWIYDLLIFCKKHNIIIRILEGTPSHDARQSRMFESINNISGLNVDLKHQTILGIEFIEKHGLSILYVPDEWKSGPPAAWADVTKALKDNGLTKVDIALMHGTFPHQLPSNVHSPMHDPDKYHSVVSEIIQIGHIHTPSILGRIVSPGSYDRMAHGEEHDKGYIKVFLKGKGKFDIERCPNPDPYPYVTVNCTNMSLEESLKIIDKKASALSKGFLRVSGEKGHPAFNALMTLKEKYPYLTFSTKANKDNSAGPVDLQENIVERASTITVSKDNILDIVKEHLIKLGRDTPNILNHLEDCIREL